ncbi:MAG: DNRLRE domain-containing protein [Pseudomonadales bacterium]
MNAPVVRQDGYVLLLVSVALLMIATATLTLFESGTSTQSRIQKDHDVFALQAALDAGVAHNVQKLRSFELCNAYTTVSNTLGAVSYSASLNTTFSSPVELTVTATHSNGRTLSRTQSVAMYSSLNFQTMEAVADAEIDEDKPDDNFGDQNSAHVRISSNNKDERFLVQFDLAPIPDGALIASARLQLTLDNNGGDDGLPDLVYRVLQNWDEDEVSWERRNDGFLGAWTTAGGTIESAPFAAFADSLEGTQVVELKQLARLWLAGAVNDGLMITSPASLGEKHFDYVTREDGTFAERPKLHIDYRCDCALGC